IRDERSGIQPPEGSKRQLSRGLSTALSAEFPGHRLAAVGTEFWPGHGHGLAAARAELARAHLGMAARAGDGLRRAHLRLYRRLRLRLLGHGARVHHAAGLHAAEHLAGHAKAEPDAGAG